ncbi:hypothetical protein EV385_3089 [Krasilnikovia cinnamomea]|uniref:ATP/GTP-binding protein n=1 Tax=Krasilnikovia cinnamomea TaxID=349313 RepID=A0A4Q7ZM00_9ACTN|nr:hypothetical protein [Krasilnikovia cinnamomea]RZU51279.1 hypothetical protein EV385_3089 [Krasilnikovia cinnamomea]
MQLGHRTHLLLALLVGLLVAGTLAPAARADDGTGGMQCSKQDPRPACDIHAGTPGRPGKGGSEGGSGGQGGDGKCRDPQGKEIPCQRDGGWAGTDGCYYKPADLSPTMIENLGGQPSEEGGWYQKVCYGPDGPATTGFGGPVWIPGAPPAVSPEILARQARAKLRLPEVTIWMNPPGDQLVNLPVWLALDKASWKTQSATASVPGVSVTATARPVTAAWSMGEGSTRACDGPGTAWKPGTDPKAASPDCGYVYRRSSAGAAGGAYTVSVTVTWEVTWAGAGQTGTVPGLSTTGHVQTRVQESQAVISR